MSLQGQTAVVMGGSSGIGLETARIVAELTNPWPKSAPEK